MAKLEARKVEEDMDEVVITFKDQKQTTTAHNSPKSMKETKSGVHDTVGLQQSPTNNGIELSGHGTPIDPTKNENGDIDTMPPFWIKTRIDNGKSTS